MIDYLKNMFWKKFLDILYLIFGFIIISSIIFRLSYWKNLIYNGGDYSTGFLILFLISAFFIFGVICALFGLSFFKKNKLSHISLLILFVSLFFSTLVLLVPHRSDIGFGAIGYIFISSISAIVGIISFFVLFTISFVVALNKKCFKGKNNIFQDLLIICILLLTCFAIAFIFAWPLMSINQKVYKNTEYGFEIQYPFNWHVENMSSIKQKDVWAFCSNDDEKCKMGAIYVYVYSTGGADDVLNMWRKQGLQYLEYNIGVDGYNAVRREESYCNSNPQLAEGVFVNKDSYSFQLQGPIFECDVDQKDINKYYTNSKKIYEKIISNFKFTK